MATHKQANGTVKSGEARRWFEAGVKCNVDFLESWRRARATAINAGFLFIKSRSLCSELEWSALLADEAERIKPRTVQFYMQLAQAALDWAKAERPELAGAKLQEFALKSVMLMSPKPLVALLRDLRIMRPFGEYDAVKYAQKKLGGGQFEFDFAAVLKPLDDLLHFGEANYQFIYPEGVDTVEFMSAVEAKLEAALARVRMIKQHGRIIDLPETPEDPKP